MVQTAMRSMPVAVLFLAAAALLAGCTGEGGPAETPTPTATAQFDAVGAWGGQSVLNEPSLALAADGTLSGSDGCNRVHGSWSDQGDAVVFENVASTRMACEELDTWLSGLATATIDGDTMTVRGEGDIILGTLDRSQAVDPATVPSRDAEAFIGTWGIPATFGEPSIAINVDGSANGTDGCNGFGGDWTIDDGTLVFGDAFTTQIGCDDIDDWLAQRATATVAGDTISFFDEAGAEIGTLSRAD